MNMVNTIAFWLLVVGGLNWGLTAFGYNVVDMLLGAGSTGSMIVYILVGLSAILVAVNSMKSNSGSMM